MSAQRHHPSVCTTDALVTARVAACRIRARPVITWITDGFIWHGRSFLA